MRGRGWRAHVMDIGSAVHAKWMREASRILEDALLLRGGVAWGMGCLWMPCVAVVAGGRSAAPRRRIEAARFCMSRSVNEL
jgi:hypothetical protein